MNLKFSRPFRIISIIVLFSFLWTFGGLFDIAYAFKNSPQTPDIRQQTRTEKPEEKFQDALEKLREAGERADGKLRRGEAIEDEEAEIKTKKAEIDNLDIEIRNQFKETEEKIKDLPEVIKQRHRDFVRKYEENLNTLRINLDDIEKAKTRDEVKDKVEKTKRFLEKVRPPKKHIPLDPNKLPHRTVEPVEVPMEEIGRKSSSAEELKEIQDARSPIPDKKYHASGIMHQASPILVASAGSLAGLLSSTITQATPSTSSGPTSADLAETIEVQFTPEINELAETLEYNPVKIFNFVRNYIDFVPTYGSIQGAQQTLLTGKGNAFDQASLLIALLRASGIYARYEYGTIEIPIEKVKNWVGGFTDSYSSLKLMASGGVPVKGFVEGGAIKVVQLEHIWVKAWIDYIPSRGTVHKQGDTWIPLDPSFKQYDYTTGIDFKTAVPFDTQSFLNEIKGTAIINEAEGSITGVDTNLAQSRVDAYTSQIENYLNTNYPTAIEEQIVRNGEIAKKELPFLPLNLPYTVKVKGWNATEIPSNLRHTIQFSVVKDVYDEYLGTPINYSVSLPEIVGKRITLSYSPATDADRTIIRSLIPKPHADGTPLQIEELPKSFPAYLINLKPELRIDGKLVATGTPITMGYTEHFTITLQSPTKGTEVVGGEAIAGEYHAIAVDVMPLGEDVIEEKILNHYDLLEQVKAKTIYPTRDQFFGEFLHTMAVGYFDQYDAFEQRFAKVMGIVAHRLPSIGVVQSSLHINYFFDFPYTANPEGIFLDIRHSETIAVSLDGDKENEINYHFISGVFGSGLEHSVPEQLFSSAENPVEGISAVKILSVANSQNIPIYTITSANIATVLPKLQTGITNEIQNAVNAGKEVTTPERNVTINGWTGTGYIIFDPKTGSGGYLISGGKSGGFLTALGTYWIACGTVIYDDDPLFGMEVIMSGINLIIQAATLWTDVLKVAGKAAFDLAMMFFPWGKVFSGVKMALGAVTSRVVQNRITGRAFQGVILKTLNLDENTYRYIVNMGGKEKIVIPDAIKGAITSPDAIIEVKKLKYLHQGSGNIMKNIELARTHKAPLRLIVPKGATLSKPLTRALSEIKWSLHEYDPVLREIIPPVP